jgi:hypothetical protein
MTRCSPAIVFSLVVLLASAGAANAVPIIDLVLIDQGGGQAGAQTFTVAELTFDLNGIGGLVETGIFFPGVDGFAGPDGFSEDGEFDASQLESIHFRSLQLAPEPSTGLLLGLGLVGVGGLSRRSAAPLG